MPEARSKFLSKKTKSWRSSGLFNLEELYCCVDDFCQKFIPLWHQQLIENDLFKHCREASLSLSEVMTILILFHTSHYHDFKTFYIQHVKHYLQADFPQLVSYTRMLTLKQRALSFLSVLFFRHARLKPRGSLLLIQPKLLFATISVFPVIAYFRASHSEGKRVLADVMDVPFFSGKECHFFPIH